MICSFSDKMDGDVHQIACNHVCGLCSKFISGTSHNLHFGKKTLEQKYKISLQEEASNMCGACVWKLKNLEKKSFKM